METRTVTHERPGEPLSVTVSEADVLMGMKRTMMISEVRSLKSLNQPDVKDDDEEKKPTMPEGEELAIYLLRRYTWPCCKVSAIGAEGFDLATLTFEAFCRLPEVFVSHWEQAALELNPHWQLRIAGDKDDEAEDEEKKDNGVSESA